MRIGDDLYFSPIYKFKDLDFYKKDTLIDAFRDRVNGFYLKPAKFLNDYNHWFGAGLLCVSTIDFLAKIVIGGGVGSRIETWLSVNIPVFASVDPNNKSQTLAARFCDEFRNGLVHEGRIKNCGQFSNKVNKIFEIKNNVIFVHPQHLINAIDSAFQKYIRDLKSNEVIFSKFKKRLQIDFKSDVDYAKQN